MAYEGGYPAQRPYGGPGAPRDPYQQAPPRPYDGAQQPHDEYDNGNGYNGYGHDNYNDGGYAQDFGGQAADQGYGRGPPPNHGHPYPPQDAYGPEPGRARPPPQMGEPPRNGYFPPRGGPPGRGNFQGGPHGRGGRPVPYERSANSDPAPSRQRPMDGGPRSPDSAGGFGSPFPVFPGQQRKSDFDQESQIMSQMSGMDISSQRPRGAPHRGSDDSQRSQMRSPDGDYGRRPVDPRGPPRGYHQGYSDPRRGPGPGPGPGPGRGPGHGPGFGPNPGYGAEYRDAGYDRQQPNDDFGPPGRSMTMPLNADPMARGPPQRTGTMPLNGPPRGMPPRPSTSQDNRPPPQRMYPPQQGAPGGGYSDYDTPDQGYRGSQEQAADVIDSYYAPSRMSNPEYTRNPVSIHPEGPDFAGPAMPRSSLEQHLRPRVQEEPQPGPSRMPDLSRTKSQPDLRQPQAAVFEMAADAPPLPSVGGPGNWDRQQPQGRPTGPPAVARAGLPAGPSPSRGPDALPSHPTPVRPGHLPNSMVSVNDRPAPVRNYNPGLGPIQGPPPQQQQQQQQQAQPPANEPSFTKPTVPVTPEELEQLRVIIKNDPNDQESALRLAKRLVEAADVLVTNLPDPRSRARARERYLMDANKILKKLSNAQNTEAMFVYADSLGRGLFSVEPDNKEAFTWYQSAAKLGHAAAAYRTAVCCEIGNDEGGGTRKDPLKAMQWYKRAATLGDTPAMYKMGMILLKGLLGQPKNPREAVSWLKRAAERADPENPHALHELGLLYESAAPNDAIIKDEAYAYQLFKQAAELGYKFSQFRLGCSFEFGLMGCPIDPRQSIMWYSKAATQEEHQAELALSGWYLTGADGVLQQSDTEAYLWARKAAMAGLAKAEYAMGYFTEVGIGAPANLEDAKRWYWRAASQDFPKARERLEDLKRVDKNGPRQRERISRSKVGKQQEVFR